MHWIGFNVTNHVSISGVAGGNSVNWRTPLAFQDAAAVTTEGPSVSPFGANTVAGMIQARVRQVRFGLRLEI